jgi:hypothetical protein
MATLTTPRRRVKPGRTIRLMLAIGEQSPGVVRITVGKLAVDYFLTRLPSDFGRGYRLEKFWHCGDEAYAVLLAHDGSHSCECKGHLSHGRCKHVSALLALRSAGRL